MKFDYSEADKKRNKTKPKNLINPDKPINLGDMAKGFKNQKNNGIDVESKIQNLRKILKEKKPPKI